MAHGGKRPNSGRKKGSKNGAKKPEVTPNTFFDAWEAFHDAWLQGYAAGRAFAERPSKEELLALFFKSPLRLYSQAK